PVAEPGLRGAAGPVRRAAVVVSLLPLAGRAGPPRKRPDPQGVPRPGLRPLPRLLHHQPAPGPQLVRARRPRRPDVRLPAAGRREGAADRLRRAAAAVGALRPAVAAAGGGVAGPARLPVRRQRLLPPGLLQLLLQPADVLLRRRLLAAAPRRPHVEDGLGP